MKVVINGRFLCQRITGVQRFAREIIMELDKIAIDEDYELYVPKCNTLEFHLQNIKIVYSESIFSGILWDIFSFSSYAKKKKALSINLCNGIIFNNPSIVCIHDITYKSAPYLNYNNLLKMYWNRFTCFFNSKHADYIMTVSEFSKKEIVKYYKVNPERIVVINSAWQHVKRVNDEGINIEKKYPFLSAGNYFFSMSTLAANKNFKWILYAAKNNPTEVFAIAGGGKLKGVADSMGFSNLSNVHFLGYVTDEEAKCLIKNCKAFIFPSLYEGFGLPPLEALGYGCQNIVVSDIEVIREIFGDDVNYIDPENFNDIIINIKKSISREKILNQYSWEKSAKLLHKLIKLCI